MLDFEILENKGVLSILCILHSLRETNRNTIVTKSKISGNTVDRRLAELKSEKIIDEEPKKGYQGSRKIYLTPKGQEIVKNINFEKIGELLK